MSRRSLPELHSRVTANASQFVSEFQRADNVSRRSVANIDREMSKLEKSVGRKFSLAGIGNSFLSGLGIGSGFAAVSTVVGVVTDHFKEQAQLTKSIDEAWARIAERSKTFSRERMSTGDRIGDIQNEVRALGDRRAAIEQSIEAQKKLWEEMNMPAADESFFKKQQLEIVELTEKMQALSLELIKLGEGGNTEAERQLTRDFEELTKQMREQVKLREKRNEDNEREIAQLDKLAERYRAMLDPLSAYKDQISEVQMLFHMGFIPSVEEADAIVAELEERMVTASGALERFFGELDKKSTTMVTGIKEKASAFSVEMAQMWNNVSDRAGQAFADMVLTGENAFKKLPELASRAVLEIVARMAIINPLLNAIFGGGASWTNLPAFFGAGATTGTAPGRARGGAAEAGVWYRFNEEGQEEFKSNTGGTVIPLGARGRGVGGITYAPVINVAAGITRQELLPALMPILKQHGRGVIAAIADVQRRGRPIASAAV